VLRDDCEGNFDVHTNFQGAIKTKGELFMRPSIDLTGLIKGLMVIILFALSIGQLDRLHEFAKQEAMSALRGWPPHPFFPQHQVAHPRRKIN
jgi:hypothetical protein